VTKDNLPHNFQDDTLVAYLLGELRGKEKDSLEQQYFQDDDLFEYLRALEDELIDGYLQNRLSARQRRQFERHFLASPLGRERLESAKALMGAVAPAAIRAPRRKWWQVQWNALSWSFACAMLVFVAGISWLIWRNINLQNQLAASKMALREREQQLQKDHSSAGPLAISFVLTPAQRDLGSSNRIVVPAEARVLNFVLDLPGRGESTYRAVFRTAEGDQVGTSTDISVSPSQTGASAGMKIPAGIFSPGTYILTLQSSRPGAGFQDVRSYSFTIARR
jgi:hypothetical protein